MAIKIGLIRESLIIILVLFTLYGCSKTYFKDSYQFVKGQTDTVTKIPSDAFNLCAAFFINQSVIYSRAEAYCARRNQKPKFIKKSYFTDCSLTNPVVYIFSCK